MNREGNLLKLLNIPKEALKKQLLVFQAVHKHDPRAYSALYDMYVSPLYRFVYFKVGSREVAEDLTANTFLRVWQYINNAEREEVEHFEALLYRIARNAVIDFYRQRQRDEKVFVSDTLEQLEPILQDSSHKKFPELNHDQRAIEHLLHGLKDLYREVLMLRFVEDRSLHEIAVITGKSQGNIRVILHRGLSALKEIIEQGNAPEVKLAIVK